MACRHVLGLLDKTRTPTEPLLRARAVAREVGLDHVYIGNVHHAEAQSSYCADCSAKVMGRDWDGLSNWRLTDLRDCTICTAPFPGVVDGPPGTWGRKRQPVRIV
ncbi:MAG: hypothetical protein AAGD13_08485 [Pseudomonadota bacterium]